MLPKITEVISETQGSYSCISRVLGLYCSFSLNRHSLSQVPTAPDWTIQTLTSIINFSRLHPTIQIVVLDVTCWIIPGSSLTVSKWILSLWPGAASIHPYKHRAQSLGQTFLRADDFLIWILRSFPSNSYLAWSIPWSLSLNHEVITIVWGTVSKYHWTMESTPLYTTLYLLRSSWSSI